jgi:hypothetical protein
MDRPILLVESNPAAIRKFRRSYAGAGCRQPLRVARDSSEALNLLRRGPRPCLAMFDAELYVGDELPADLPLVVWAPRDRRYRRPSNAVCLYKPEESEEYRIVLAMIRDQWLGPALKSCRPLLRRRAHH